MYLTPPDVAEDFHNEILSRLLKDKDTQAAHVCRCIAHTY